MKTKEEIKKEILRMIMLSNFSYDTWLRFWLLRAPNEVGLKQAELNVKIYKDFGQLFTTLEESALTSFSVIFSQLFDKRSDVVSLYLLSKQFNKNLEQQIDNLKKHNTVKEILDMRMKFFAHNDITGKYIKRIVPSDNDITTLFNKVVELYEKITNQKIILRSMTGEELSSLFIIIQKSNPRRFKL